MSNMSLELSNDMLPKIALLYNTLGVEFVDVSKLKQYEEDCNRSESLRGEDLYKVASDALRAMDMASNYHYIANRFAKFAHLKYDEKSAQLYYVEGAKFLEDNKVKESHSAREKFVDQHPDYIALKNIRDSWQALCDWLQQKYDIFLQKHMWAKKRIDCILAEQKGMG